LILFPLSRGNQGRKELRERNHSILSLSRMTFHKNDRQARAVFTVTRHPEGWAVEHEGELLDPCRTQEEARAAATRRARACQDGGRLAQINMQGERGFFTERVKTPA